MLCRMTNTTNPTDGTRLQPSTAQCPECGSRGKYDGVITPPDTINAKQRLVAHLQSMNPDEAAYAVPMQPGLYTGPQMADEIREDTELGVAFVALCNRGSRNTARHSCSNGHTWEI